MSEEYLEREYHLAVLDYKLARGGDALWDARRQLARLEQIAAELFGFAFCDALHRKEFA